MVHGMLIEGCVFVLYLTAILDAMILYPFTNQMHIMSGCNLRRGALVLKPDRAGSKQQQQLLTDNRYCTYLDTTNVVLQLTSGTIDRLI